MSYLFLVLLFGITESSKCNQCFHIDIECYSEGHWYWTDLVTYSNTGSKLRVLRMVNWYATHSIIEIDGVDYGSIHKDVCIDTVDSTKFENGWIVSIGGDDGLWADRFRVTKNGDDCKGTSTWGASNAYGWCLSTDPNDWNFAKYNSNGCGYVPGKKCYRSFYISDNGSVYLYRDPNYSLFGRRRLQGLQISFEDLLAEQNGKYFHVDKNGNAIGQPVDDGFNIVPPPVTPAPTPGSTSGLNCNEISKLPGLTSQDQCTLCGATSYCKAQLKNRKKQNKCKCKKLKCKRCKKDQTCCLTNPEGCTWNPTAKNPCS